MKYIDAKVTHINGEVHVSWKTEDGNWQAESLYDIPDYIAQDAVQLKDWFQAYKEAYNLGKDVEAANASIPNIPAQVTSLLNQPLNLS